MEELICHGPADLGHAGIVPAGMDDPEAVKIEPEGQRAEPVEVGGQFAGRDLPQRLAVAWPEVLTGLVGISRVVGEGVEFVVAHHRQDRTRVDHAHGR